MSSRRDGCRRSRTTCRAPRRLAGADDPGSRHRLARLGAPARSRSAAATAASRSTTAAPGARRRAARPVRPRADGRRRDRGARRRGHRARARDRRVDGRRDRADHRRAAPRPRPLARARVHRVPAPRVAPRAARRVGRRGRRARDGARSPTTACAGSSARASQRRFGVLAQRARALVLQQPPEPFVAQVDAILDAPDDLRFELRDDHAPDARDHRLAGHAHAARRRRGARRADPARAAATCSRRRARPDGRGAERVQRRGAALPRRDRRRGREPAAPRPVALGRIGRRLVSWLRSTRPSTRRRRPRGHVGVELVGAGRAPRRPSPRGRARPPSAASTAPFADASRARLVEPLGVELAAEQVAQRRVVRRARRSPAACRRLRAGRCRPACRARPRCAVTSSTSSTIWKHMPR